MPSTPRAVWISPQAYERLHRELDTLRYLCAAEATDTDPDENTVAVQRAWQVRIQQIHDLLVNAVVGEDPPDDGIAEPGMVVTIRYDATVTPTHSYWACRVPSTVSWRSTPSNRRWAPPS
jgi:transcription elongation factor GreA